MGAVLTATSIGVTVRILMDMGRLNTREGTTILVGAVVDDIIGLKFNKYISRYLLGPFKDSGTAPIVALIIGFIIAYLVTLVELHPVVGAYVAGLMFSACNEKEEIMEEGHPIMIFAAPFFFAYLGMMVDLRLFGVPGAAVLSVVLIIVAIVGKMLGCYIAARPAGKLSHVGGMIVATCMVPRAEMGLIVAAAGYIAGAISLGLYGTAVAVSVVTTLVTPVMLKPWFKRMPLGEAPSSNPELSSNSESD